MRPVDAKQMFKIQIEKGIMCTQLNVGYRPISDQLSQICEPFLSNLHLHIMHPGKMPWISLYAMFQLSTMIKSFSRTPVLHGGLRGC